MIRQSDLIYKKGYKYQIIRDCAFKLPFGPDVDWTGEWITYLRDGTLIATAGYAWDGPSGPTFDTDDFMAGSLAHDMLYQLMGLGILSADKFRKLADQILVDVCKEDGMPAIRRAWVYAAVRAGGARPARTGDNVYTLPKPVA
jgi:hypothetical protein